MDSLGESVSNGKTLVANAITAKGVSTSTSATFSTMATNIGKIKTTPTTFKANAFGSNNYTITDLVKNKTYILSIANMNSVTNNSYIKSGGTVLKMVHKLSTIQYASVNSFITTIMFKATSTSVVVQNIGDSQFACWTLIEI